MKPERWGKLQALFYAASEMEPARRGDYLEAECREDPSLRLQVESLIFSSTEDAPTVLRALGQVAASVAAVRIGDRIGPWEVIRELGHGGMGSVYLAVRADDHYRQQVAIKLMNLGLAGPEMLSRFRAERQILANLDHPNIARLLDGGATSGGVPYVLMEYVDGTPIDVFCRERVPGVRERLALFRQLCSAVIYAHRNLVVHRDIKPANVLVTPDGTPKLLDFGIAKLIGAEAATETAALTRVNERLMTPEYASPEQVRGETITTASDVYSLGVVLYEILTGRRPFEVGSANALEILRTINETEPARPSAGGPRELKGDLDNIVLMAMRKEPARRYASVDQFSEDIQRYLDGFPVIAREDTWGYRTGKFVRRHRWGVVAASVFLALLIAFSAGMALLARRVAAERDIATNERHNAEQVAQFLIDSFRVADRSGQQGRTVTAQEILDRGSERIFKQLNDQPAVRARMMNTMGEVYESLGLYDRSQILLNNALETRRRMAGPMSGRSEDVVESLSALGELVETKGEYAAAESYYRTALASEQAISGPDSAATAEVKAKLGSALASGAKAEEARRLLNEALATRKELFGDQSAQVADSLIRLGRLEDGLQRFAEAEPYLRQALSIRRAVLGPESPETANSVSDLAALLNTRGNLNEAETMQREALALHRKLYGESHILVGEDVAALGVLRFNSGDFNEAVALDRQAVAIFRAALGEESPRLADAMTELANSLERQGKLEDAEAIMRQALAMNTKLLGPDHPATANIKHNLVNVLHDAGKNAEAEKLMTGLVAWQRAQNPDSPALGFNLAALGGLKRARGDWHGADADYHEALEIFRKAFGENHPTYARALTSLATNRIALRDYKSAELMLDRAISILRKVEKTNPLDLSFPLVALGQDLLAESRPAEAETAARESYEIRRRLAAQSDSRVALAESVLGGSLAAQHRYEEAEPLLVESHKNLLRFREDRAMQGELMRLGQLYRAWGRTQ